MHGFICERSTTPIARHHHMKMTAQRDAGSQCSEEQPLLERLRTQPSRPGRQSDQIQTSSSCLAVSQSLQPSSLLRRGPVPVLEEAVGDVFTTERRSRDCGFYI